MFGLQLPVPRKKSIRVEIIDFLACAYYVFIHLSVLTVITIGVVVLLALPFHR